MTSLSRRTATAGLLTVALMGVPSAALAAGPDARPAQATAGQDRAAEARSDEAGERGQAPSSVPSATPSARAERSAAGAAGGAAAGKSAARPEQARSEQARSEQARPEKARPAQARADKPKPDKARPAQSKPAQPKPAKARADKPKADAPARTADPRGNNGTFKVDGPVLDTSHGNEPHVSCEFRLNFFGYDAGQLADISFTAVAPTRGATTKVDGLQLISSSPAKGGQYGGSYPVTGTWDAGDLGLDPTQRQHVKVSVESVNADGSAVPGGAKHKVFWLEPCATAAAEPAVQPVVVASMGGTSVFGPRAVLPRPVAAAPAAAPETAVSGGSVSALTATPVAVVAAPASLVQPFVLPPVSARASAPPAQLPFTGSPELLALLLGGVVTLAGGSALLIAVRRSA